MHRLYKSITAALAFAGCLSLVITGEMNPIFLIPALAIIPGYYRYIKGKPPLSRWLIAGLAVLEMFVLAFDMLVISEDYLVAIAHMTIMFQALKSYDFQTPWDPLQVYFMSLLQLIITSELSLSIAVGGVFAGFLLVFMAALVISHFMNEGSLGRVGIRRPVIMVSLAALCLTAAFFVLVPRVSGGLWGRKAAHGIKTVGFSDTVSFGSFGEMLDNDTIVMRVELSGPKIPLYWRGVTLDYFDGNSWVGTLKYNITLNKREGWFEVSQGYPQRQRRYDADEIVEQKIILEPLDNNVLFGLDQVESVSARGWGVSRDTANSIYMYDKDDRRISYSVRSVLPSGGYPVNKRFISQYLQVPDNETQRIHDLSRTVVINQGSDFKRAQAIERYLSAEYQYSLVTTAPASGSTAMDHFLFVERRGYCEHFASAMVLMLRSIEIPSRIVNGFMGGEENEYGGYVIVRQRNAHSWVEASIDGSWVRFDPTPPAPSVISTLMTRAMDAIRMGWYRYVIGFSYSDQLLMLKSFNLPMIDLPDMGGIRVSVRPYFVLIGVAIVLAVWLVRSGAGRVRHQPSSRVYLRVKARVASMKGAVVGDASTPQEVIDEASRLAGDLPALDKFIRSYESIRFGYQESADLSVKAEEALRELDKARHG